MAIVRWNPWRDVVSVQDEMERMFDGLLRGSWPSLSRRTEVWSPPVDVVEKEDEFVVTAELPGMNQKDVKVSIMDNVLSIKGEKREEKEEKNGEFRRVERCYGSFERSFTLSAPVESDKIEAKYKNGILEIRLPKAEKARAKEIPVDVK